MEELVLPTTPKRNASCEKTESLQEPSPGIFCAETLHHRGATEKRLTSLGQPPSLFTATAHLVDFSGLTWDPLSGTKCSPIIRVRKRLQFLEHLRDPETEPSLRGPILGYRFRLPKRPKNTLYRTVRSLSFPGKCGSEIDPKTICSRLWIFLPL